MKTAEFQQNYEIDHQSLGVKATSKRSAAEYPVAQTADGRPFNHAAVYFFFDRSANAVRDTSHLRRIDAENVGSLGLRISSIDKLRENKDDALDDAQKHCLDEIEKLRQSIRELEEQKSAKGRSLKRILMAGR
ncbi:MAG TPA: hypothetical protein VL325_06130 [Pyrinomonadaceae bacterium]|jgi:hypothetical protein|nr:hypothetical protein [Pyrinomonadaceae bacterium]